MVTEKDKWICSYHDIVNSSGIASLVGKKATYISLAYCKGFNVPRGFCMTNSSFLSFLRNLNVEINKHYSFREIYCRATKVISVFLKAQNFIRNNRIASEIIQEINRTIRENSMSKNLVVRSSALSEDESYFSSAGLYKTVTNVPISFVDESIRKVWDSYVNFPNIVLAFSPDNQYISVGGGVIVQDLIPSEISGVLYLTRDQIIIESNWGYGETTALGKVFPDYFEVDLDTSLIRTSRAGQKEFFTLEQDLFSSRVENNSLITLNNKRLALLSSKVDNGKVQCKLSKELQFEGTLSFAQVRQLCTLAKEISNVLRMETMYIEWCIANGVIYVIQVRPLTMHKLSLLNYSLANARKGSLTPTENRKFRIKNKILCNPVSPGKVIGEVIYLDSTDVNKISRYDQMENKIIIVKEMDPHSIVFFLNVKGIILERGAFTSHTSITLRELGISCVVCNGIRKHVQNGDVVLIDGTGGAIYL